MSRSAPLQDWFVSVELHTVSGGELIHGTRVPGPSEEMIRHARVRGLRTAVLASDRDFYKTDLDNLVDEWIVCDTRDPAAIHRAVASLPGRVAAVTSLVDTFVGPVAAAARSLGLRGPSPGTAALARDKAVARAALAAAGIPDVHWAVREAADPSIESPLGYPVVVKPVDGAASWDVELATGPEEVRALARRHLARRYPRGVQPQHRLLFEEYVTGPLYSAEGVVDATGQVQVLGWSSRRLTDPPHFAELAVTFAQDEPFEGASQYAESLLHALGYDFGPFHLEVIAGPAGPRLVELNPRLVGSGAHACIEEVIGYSGIDLVVAQLLGEAWPKDLQVAAPPPADQRSSWRSATQMYFVPDVASTVLARPNREMLSDWSEVVAAASQVSVGDELAPLVRSSSDYLGWVITRGRDRTESEAAADRVLKAWQRTVRGELTRVN